MRAPVTIIASPFRDVESLMVSSLLRPSESSKSRRSHPHWIGTFRSRSRRKVGDFCLYTGLAGSDSLAIQVPVGDGDVRRIGFVGGQAS